MELATMVAEHGVNRIVNVRLKATTETYFTSGNKFNRIAGKYFNEAS